MNNNFKRLNQNGNSYFITSTQPFNLISTLSNDTIISTFNFAYDMTFGELGEHRNHRTGGTHKRRNGEIFANAFQGKLAEFAIYEYLSNKNIEMQKPDLGVYQLGKWDVVDLEINNKSISIKSTKSFGNLLLLEKNDWDNNATYIPNKKSYDFTILVRLNPFCEEIMKKNKLLYSDEISKETLLGIITNETWGYDIPGFVTKDELIYIIQNEYIIPQDALLNGRISMDASNYYIQSGDMHNIQELISYIN